MGTQQTDDFAQVLAAAGMTVTAEGRRRARAQLDKARETFTEERRAELRALGTTAA